MKFRTQLNTVWFLCLGAMFTGYLFYVSSSVEKHPSHGSHSDFDKTSQISWGGVESSRFRVWTGPIEFSPDLDFFEQIQFGKWAAQDIAKKLSPESLRKNKLLSKSRDFSTFAWLGLTHRLKHAQNVPWQDEAISFLHHALQECSEHLGNSRVVRVPFRFSYAGKPLKPGWVGALTNAFAMQGYLNFYEITGDRTYLHIASEYFSGLKRMQQRFDRKWMSFVDQDGFLWFEEYPLKTDPQPRVLNGHIYSVIALYNYYVITKDVSAKVLIQGGIATMRTYLDRYRRPGKVSRYGLGPNSPSDYGDVRNLNQVRWLFEITGDHYFGLLAQLFERDYRDSGRL